MRKLVFAAALALPLATTAVEAQPIGLGTSPQGTLTYTLGATVAKALSDTAGLQSRVQPSSGTGTMIPLVNSGEVDVGFCNTLELYEAFHGVATFDKRPNPKLRTVGVLFPIRVGLFVRADSPIKSIKDLKGRTISYGYASQEIIKTTVDAMLAAAGLSIADMKTVMVPNLVRGVDEFMAGRVEVTTFALGQAKVAEADASVGGIRFLDFGGDSAGEAAMKKVFRTAYMATVAPAPNIPYVKAPIVTMAYDYTVFANADLPAAKVKEITRVLAEQKDAMAQAMPLFRAMKTERMFNDIGVPYHDGAIAYFKEKGVQPSK